MFIAVFLIVLIALDQLVKTWALTTLAEAGSIPLIEGVFHLTYVENRGAAFSILQNQRWFFLLITPVVLAVIWVAVRKGYIQTALGRVSAYLIAAGAVGNFIDRLVRGFVVDLFDFCLISFPVFNVADVYLVCGVALFLYYIFFQHKDTETGHG